jgi:hypothetical protein
VLKIKNYTEITIIKRGFFYLPILIFFQKVVPVVFTSMV